MFRILNVAVGSMICSWVMALSWAVAMGTWMVCGAGHAGELELASVNPGFEANVSGWTSSTLPAQVITRPWTPDPGRPAEQLLGRRLISIQGDGGWAQWFVIRPGVRHQVLSIRAYRELVGGVGLGAWAGFGVTYYDANWNQIASTEREILGRGPASRGTGDGLVAYSFGVSVPEEAVYGSIWCWDTSATTRVYLDEFALFDYAPSDTANLLSEGFSLGQYTGVPALLRGDEFFLPADPYGPYDIRSNWPSRASVTFGTGGVQTTAYQFLSLAPNRTYEVSVDWRRDSVTDVAGAEAWVGLDLYNSAFQRIDKLALDTNPRAANGGAGQFSTSTAIVTTRSDLALATFWVWTEGNGVNPLEISRVRIVEQPSGDVELPEARLVSATSINRVAEPDSSVIIAVGYTDNEGIDLSSTDERDITVLGPNGQPFGQVLVGGPSSVDPVNSILVYFMEPPSGGWTSAHVGRYTIRYNDGEVVDTSGNAALGKILGTFDVQ